MELEEAIKDIKRICEYLKESDYMSIDKDTKISLETVLNELDSLKFKYQARKDRTDTIIKKQEKMIELMSRFIDTELSSEHLSKVLKIEVKPLETYRENIKELFEKKAEESE